MKQSTLIVLLFCTIAAYGQTDQLTKSLNAYSFDLYGEIKSDLKNMFISPLSTYYALLVAYEGSHTKTQKEFENVLHIKDPAHLSEFNSFSNNLVTCQDSSNYLNISNAIWLQQDFNINNGYRKKIVQRYSSELITVDFKKKLIASQKINKWVYSKTNGLIPEIISENDINKNTRVVISNAIYFIGKWSDEFDRNDTKPGVFYSIDKNKPEVDFMNKSFYLRYYENEDFQFVSIPYKGEDKSFCIILPKKRYGLIDIEKELSPSILETSFIKATNQEINLSIPKFKLETSYSLIEPLQELGLKQAFTPQADFSGITSEASLMIDKVLHKAYIEIDEEKTEAAATTAVVMTLTSALSTKPRLFKADHPFIFLVVDNNTKGIIFIGRYVQP